MAIYLLDWNILLFLGWLKGYLSFKKFVFFFCSVVKVRETRLTGFLSSSLIALSLLMLPIPLTLIPTPVLDGLFLFMAVTSLYGNQMFERALLLVTEQVGRISNSFVTGLCPNRVQLSQMSKVHLSHIVLLSGRAFQSYVPGFLRFRVSS